jgi:NDP-sugar pyrophosphorylase family protein
MSGPPAAFILAAGLGTRLAPITDFLPKPLVPMFHKPLLTFALDSLMAAGVGTLALNTHHLPHCFTEVLGAEPSYRERPLHLFHEPLLLDTGGGIRNARSALEEKTFFLYNGDILADLPLADLLAAHRASGALATLLLRDGGGVPNVRFDAPTGRILDLRGALGVKEGALFVYSGIAVFEPAIFDWLPEGRSSIIDALLEAMRAGGRVGGLLCRSEDHHLWIDIGTPAAYLEAHRLLADPANRPSYLRDEEWPDIESGWRVAELLARGERVSNLYSRL